MEDKVERDKEISEELRMEVKGVEDIYEELLLKNTKFPRAEELNEDVLAWVDCVFHNWTTLESRGSEARRVSDILYRASQKTFYSPRILRYLFITLTASGNFHNAELSLDTYITLVK